MFDASTRPRLASAPKSPHSWRRDWSSASNATSINATSLLGEVLAGLQGISRPIVQIVATTVSADAMDVARPLAAAATYYGRTLLVSPDVSETQHASVRGLYWLMSELHVKVPDSAMPDGAVAGLYHAYPRNNNSTAHKMSAWLLDPQDFQMVVVASPAIAADPRSIATAMDCHGSILAVVAGVTRLEDVLSGSRQLTRAGARVLGTVLCSAVKHGLGLRRSYP